MAGLRSVPVRWYEFGRQHDSSGSSSNQSSTRTYSNNSSSSKHSASTGSSSTSSKRQYVAPTNLPAATGRYTVVSGDTLSKIAAAHGVQGGWQTLAGLNRSTIANPNLIFPGQSILL